MSKRVRQAEKSSYVLDSEYQRVLLGDEVTVRQMRWVDHIAAQYAQYAQ
ncbi:hypothetical protein [Pseudonocardia sp. HH130629-09]|nr:hypothetical protein [Pseudonocardia sp. HH130629-09]